MPVIVVGADTQEGRALVEGLLAPGREVRAFVSDIDAAAELKQAGVKVAVGDVSDDSHVQGAALNCFTAVLVTEAARDGRERSFASAEDQVLRGWAMAAETSGVTRVIWVHDGEVPPVAAKEVRTVSPAHPSLVSEVVALDDARLLPDQ
ncbi:MAG: NAD(P)H-binding protein [Acidimicrobiia bacterium]